MRARFLVLLPLMLAACPPPPPPVVVPGAMESTGEKLATVDGIELTQDMVDALTARVPKDQMAQILANPAQHKEMLDQIAFSQALYKRALDEKIAEDPEVKKLVAMATRQIIGQELVERSAAKAVTDEAIKAAYDKHAVQYNRPSVNMQHMIVKDKALGDEIVASLKAGGVFADLAKAKSIDGGQNGGDLGWVERGRLIAELETPAFAGAKGDIVGPIETPHGFHIMKLNDVRQSTPLEDVKAELTEEVKRAAMDEFVATVKKDMKVEWAGKDAPKDTPADGAAAGDAHKAHPPGDGHGH